MKVANVMNKQVESVATDTSVAEVCRYIFGCGINGVPVCKDNKVVGFITERDILAQFYPSIKEYVEDPFHAGNFEEMEKKATEVLALKAEDIMSKNPTTISSDVPLLHAQSIMFIHKIGRLPVIDKDGNLVGIISKGDIFRAVVGDKLPLEKGESFYDWLAKRYDFSIDWGKRLSSEIPDLTSLFKRERVRKIADIVSGTGEHAIALAKRGFITAGFEASNLMIKTAESKRDKLPESIGKRIKFIKGPYSKTITSSSESYDAAVFLGDALLHVVFTDNDILKHVIQILRKKRAVLVFQIANLDKIFKTPDGCREFTISKFTQPSKAQKAFLRFYTQEDNKQLTYTTAIFEHGNNQWNFRGIRGTPIVWIQEKEITKMLKKLGFSNILFYGGKLNGPLFLEPFKPLESDWLNVIAIRE